MAKAAARLGVSHPTVSEVISGLEDTFGVRLLDRGPQGVEPTMYGSALLKRGTAAFDELQQSGRDMEFLADPSVGQLRIGCPESISVAVLAPVIKRFAKQYPRVVLHVEDVPSSSSQLSELRARKHDLILARIVRPLTDAADVNVVILFNDRLAVAADSNSRWAHRRRIELAELANEPWIMTAPDTWNYALLAEAFHARGLDMPKPSLVALSGLLRTHLLVGGRYITAFAASVLRLQVDRYGLKLLPVALPDRPLPVAILTVKDRTLSPAAERFIECAREVAKTFDGRPQLRKR